MVLIALLLLTSLGTLGVLSLLQQQTAVGAPNQLVGHTYFLSNRQFNTDGDEVPRVCLPHQRAYGWDDPVTLDDFRSAETRRADQ